MTAKAESRLTPRERLARGLTYSTVGPVDLTRGIVGLGVDSARSTDVAAAPPLPARPTGPGNRCGARCDRRGAGRRAGSNCQPPASVARRPPGPTPPSAPVGAGRRRARGVGRRRCGIQHRSPLVAPRAFRDLAPPTQRRPPTPAVTESGHPGRTAVAARYTFTNSTAAVGRPMGPRGFEPLIPALQNVHRRSSPLGLGSHAGAVVC